MLRSAEEHYRQQSRLVAVTVAAARRVWSRVSVVDLDGSWEAVAPALLGLVVTAQTTAAQSSVRYVPAALAEQGIPTDAESRVQPRSLAGVASDGRNLGSLLRSPLTTAKQHIRRGFTPESALATARSSLDTIVATQVQDAGRVAESLATTVRPQVGGYVRMLSPPSCSRCAILAGRFYRWSAGFGRHPRCDCRHIPSQENTAGDLTTDPQAYFDSLPPAEQERVFTKAGAEAIRDGADPARVVNARRGMSTTTEGRKVTGARLMPEQICADAADRADAIRLLRRFGYVT